MAYKQKFEVELAVATDTIEHVAARVMEVAETRSREGKTMDHRRDELAKLTNACARLIDAIAAGDEDSKLEASIEAAALQRELRAKHARGERVRPSEWKRIEELEAKAR